MEAKRAAGKVVDPLEAGFLVYEQANRKMTRGELDTAQRLYEESVIFAKQSGSDLSATIARGKIADVLQARDELDEALRIRREDELPVYERLSDVRSLLVGRANLALVFLARIIVTAMPNLRLKTGGCGQGSL